MNDLSIENRIILKRKELVSLVAKNGLKDSSVLKCSQELDLLIYQAQVIDREFTCIALSCQD